MGMICVYVSVHTCTTPSASGSAFCDAALATRNGLSFKHAAHDSVIQRAPVAGTGGGSAARKRSRMGQRLIAFT